MGLVIHGQVDPHMEYNRQVTNRKYYMMTAIVMLPFISVIFAYRDSPKSRGHKEKSALDWCIGTCYTT